MTKSRCEVVDLGFGRISWITQCNFNQCIDLLQEGRIEGVGIDVSQGCDLKTINVLKDVKKLRGLWLSNTKGVDKRSLPQFGNLEFLGVRERYSNLNLSEMCKLKDISITWPTSIQWPDEVGEIRHIRLQKFSPKCGSLMDLSHLTNLSTLHLAQGSIKKLRGIECFKKLEELQLHYLMSLESMEDIRESSVKKLVIDHCKKVSGLENVVKCNDLQIVQYHDSKKLHSIKFINECNNLKEFRFINVDVDDGDMTPLLRLESYAFTNKKNFSHTEKQLAEIKNS